MKDDPFYIDLKKHFDEVIALKLKYIDSGLKSMIQSVWQSIRDKEKAEEKAEILADKILDARNALLKKDHDILVAKVEELSIFKNILEGKASQKAVNYALVISVLSLVSVLLAIIFYFIEKKF